jgi:flagellar hook-associated protein 3 FlgL
MKMVVAMLDQQQEKVNNLEQQVSSGLRINQPSDDPSSAQQVLNLQGIMAATDQYSRNIQTGTTWLNQMDSSMTNMNNVLTNAKQLATQMANGTFGASDRQNAAVEVTQLRDQMISLGNTQIAGKYVYGGFVSDQPPFDASGNFSGTGDQVNIQVDQGSYLSINYSGGKLLRGGTPPGSGGTDIIGVLNNLITALNSNDVTGVGSSISGLNSSLDQVQAAQGDVGARENRLQNAGNTLTSTKDYLTKAVSGKQDADLTQILSNLATQQTAFQATLAATAKFSQLSLLDYMQ